MLWVRRTVKLGPKPSAEGTPGGAATKPSCGESWFGWPQLPGCVFDDNLDSGAHLVAKHTSLCNVARGVFALVCVFRCGGVW